jgi:hypothetical protein
MGTRIYIEYLYRTIPNKTFLNNKVLDLFRLKNFGIKFVMPSPTPYRKIMKLFHVKQVIRSYKLTDWYIFTATLWLHLHLLLVAIKW